MCIYIYTHVYLVLKCFTNLLIHVQAKYDTIVFFGCFPKITSRGQKPPSSLTSKRLSPSRQSMGKGNLSDGWVNFLIGKKWVKSNP